MTEAAASALAPEGLAEVLRTRWVEDDVRSLRDAIYLRAYARDLTGPGPRGSSISAAELTRLLSAANQSSNRWESGWRIEQVADHGAIVAISGERRRTFAPGEYAATFAEHLPPRSGMAVTVWLARESLTVQVGVYYAFGNAIPEAGEKPNALRAYFHSPEDLLPDLYFHLTGQLNRLEVPFTLKTLLSPPERDRSDATVLYFSRRHSPQVERVLGELPGDLLSRLDPRTPLFTLRFAPGIGIAETPSSGVSFGMHRCGLLAESILEARRGGSENAESRLWAAERRFRAAGIDLAHAHAQSPYPGTCGTAAPDVTLSAMNVVDWLRSKGLLLIDSGTAPRVRPHNSRNRNFAIALADGGGYFVKQLRVQDSESLRMMEREAAMYECFANSGSPLRGLSPAFHGFDRGARALVLDLEGGFSGGPPSPSFCFSEAFATAAARTLALLHRQRPEDLASHSRAPLFDHRPPGIYDAHRGGPLVRWLAAGQLRLLERVRERHALAAALDRMFDGWSTDRLIHGDVKWENCLWVDAPAGAPALKWIDWELADLGDPCWDAGCFVQAYLSYWVRNLPPETQWGLADRLQRGCDLFAAIRPAVRTFLREYVAESGIRESEAQPVREEIMCCAAARMVQMALEVMHGQPEPTPEAVCLLETSAEIIARQGEVLAALGC